ncbi:CHAT domain-containing tetratricopeptide repeat protein [Calothrix sp. UHCC 0171]|uniref:CHAT domain-containing tetratricopeptide repeat protein n=1 Tax=Calothrix sp. UHCC 0171 TaxID=3110245 RepID=UPI002B218466|nr:CHAT domain-containing protein [Calothrix sp. UHCC 0171]MEA5573477.1 CHAT domain-containing protein [Calothrix sp. UHCC 0171]
MKKIYISALVILGTFAITLPSAKPVSLYVTQVMHNSRKAEADRLFKLGEQQLKSKQPEAKAKAALEFFQKALPIYQQLRERLAEGHTHKSIGNAYIFLKDFSQATTHQEQALSIAREIKNTDLEARALLNLGIINFNSPQGNTLKAIDFYQQSLAVARSSQNREMEQYALSTVKTSIELLEKNLVNVRGTKDKRREINILVSLGNAYTAVGDNSKAIASFEQAVVIARELKDTQLEISVLQNQGQALVRITSSYLQGKNFTAAIKYSQESIAIARKIKDPKLEIIGLGFLASAYILMGNLQQAIKIQEEEQKIFEKNEAPWVALMHGREHVLLCNNYDLSNEYDKAIACYRNGITISQEYQKNQNSEVKASNRIAEFQHLLGLGVTYQKMNQNRESIKLLESAYVIYPQIKNNSYLTGFQNTILQLLGTNYLEIGETDKAIEFFQQIVDSNDKISAKITAHTSLGLAFLSKSKYNIGLENFNKAIKIAQDSRNPFFELAAYQGIGNAYASIASIDEAIKYQEKVLDTVKKYSDCTNQNNFNLQSNKVFFSQQQQVILCPSFQRMEVQTLTFLGSLYTRARSEKYNFNLGVKYINQGLELARKLKLADEEATALRYLGSANSGQGNWKAAIHYYEQVLALDRETTDAKNSLQWNSKADLMQTLAIQYAASGNLDKAFQIQRNAESLLQKNPNSNPHTLAIMRWQAGFLYFLTKDNQKAEKLLSEAVDKYDSILDSGIGNKDANRVQFFDSYLGTYQTLVEVLLAQNKKEDALEISERSRARILAKLLANSSSNSKNSDFKTQTPKISLPQIQQIAKQQNATLVNYQIVYDILRVIPSSAKNKQPQVPATKILIWVVQPNGKITFHQSNLTQLLQNQTSLETLVKNTLESIPSMPTNANPNNRTRGNNQLTFKKGDRVTLKNDRAKDPAWEVVVVDNDTLTLRLPSFPPGVTSTYPITDVKEKIGDKGSQPSANAKNRYLQQLHRLLIEPIAKDLPTQEDARVIFIPQQELFAVPFPALQDSQGKYLIEKHTILTSPSIQVLQLTHQQRQRVPGSAKDVLLVGNPIMPKVPPKKPGEKPTQLDQLPGSEGEVKAIAPLFQAKPLIGKEATKNAILPMLPKARIIHFATHGILDDVRGLGSAIALTPYGNDNGLLTAEEIFDLKLNAELVVISACNTGKGRITGDGVIGLSRSLMNAGVPSVLVTLWDIPDGSTTRLMTEFYRNLQQNKFDKAKSLRKAMLTMIEQDLSPNSWAAFNLIGNAE